MKVLEESSPVGHEDLLREEVEGSLVVLSRRGKISEMAGSKSSSRNSLVSLITEPATNEQIPNHHLLLKPEVELSSDDNLENTTVTTNGLNMNLLTPPPTPSSKTLPFIMCPFAYIPPSHARQRRHSSHEAMTITDIEDEGGDSMSCFINTPSTAVSSSSARSSGGMNGVQDSSTTNISSSSGSSNNIMIGNNNTSSCLYSSLMMNRRALINSKDASTTESASVATTALPSNHGSSSSVLKTVKHGRKCTLLRHQRSSWHAHTKHSSSTNRLLDFQMQRQPLPLRTLLLSGRHHDVTLDQQHHKHHHHHHNHTHPHAQHTQPQPKSSTLPTTTTVSNHSVKTRRSSSNSSGIPSGQHTQESDSSDSRSLTEESISVRSFDSSLDEPVTSPFSFLHDFSPVVNTSSTTILFKPYNHDSRYKREGAGFSESEIATLLIILFIKMILLLVHLVSPKFSEWIRKCCFS
ncbi:hypothetical protein C9374_006813 [Naegleria lovaniensis]|uniref:Uncharacterized protein n=1 Tax=Naegleria lovaniensis TaxID=51637 RepID=A0AA88H5U6_NAELO|nr:uncharacterized protein C9374_006813 [Naegleria lovaniensis]KAG2393282.1 hypothetical protein C9374_006813 [Naegleria lovaniensis]